MSDTRGDTYASTVFIFEVLIMLIKIINADIQITGNGVV